MVTPFLHIWISQINPPKQVHAISTAQQPPLIPQNKSKKHMNLVVNN